MAETKLHQLPADMKRAIATDKAASELWNQITPLAKNEWICWVTSGKKAETRNIRLKKLISKMNGGMRRPCCFAGCPHRKNG